MELEYSNFIATTCMLNGLISIPDSTSFVSSLRCPFCGPPSHIFIEYRGLFTSLGGKGGRGVKLTGHLCPVPRSRLLEPCLHSPIHIHNVVPSCLQLRTRPTCVASRVCEQVEMGVSLCVRDEARPRCCSLRTAGSQVSSRAGCRNSLESARS
jgi:hypothetical protein